MLEIRADINGNNNHDEQFQNVVNSCTTYAKLISTGVLVIFEFYAPTYEDVKRWSTSFDCLMNHPVGQKMFADFLKSEFSDENILFWQACEDLKKEKNSEKIEEKARIIYEDFVSILSPKEVSLDSRVREIVNSNMVRPNAHTFDEAQAQIFTLMQRDSYPRFIGSEFFKNFTSTFVESES
ncbi:putative regulator of G protein signaling domain protein [Trichinella spiralis]|uniref:putative regulator of G protein signaling domain protein n=1 Tax=Trichinella spiralis TaxID=6334 RepID=UPI0001EFE165|nr:putative regulator of G protein signaling domain protein [Trichinella spiralis]